MVENQAGSTTYNQDRNQQCACAPCAPCRAVCEEYCGGQGFEATCTNCLNGISRSQPCFANTTAQCAGDPGCAAFTACIATCF